MPNIFSRLVGGFSGAFAKVVLTQVGVLLVLAVIVWGGQSLYSAIDKTKFQNPISLPDDAASLTENEKGKLLIDSITHQMQYELGSTFGWSFNDIIFNKYFFDNRAYRQYGVYHATKFLVDLFARDFAKLGPSDKESDFLYRARINQLAIDPRSFMFPSAEGSYKKGLELIAEYKKSLDEGKGVYNCRSDDLYTAFNYVTGENLLGYALGLLQNAQNPQILPDSAPDLK